MNIYHHNLYQTDPFGFPLHEADEIIYRTLTAAISAGDKPHSDIPVAVQMVIAGREEEI